MARFVPKMTLDDVDYVCDCGRAGTRLRRVCQAVLDDDYSDVGAYWNDYAARGSHIRVLPMVALKHLLDSGDIDVVGLARTSPIYDGPHASDADDSYPDDSRSNYSRPDYSRSNYSRPDYSRSNYSRPDYSRPDYSRPDYSRPDDSRPDDSRPGPVVERLMATLSDDTTRLEALGELLRLYVRLDDRLGIDWVMSQGCDIQEASAGASLHLGAPPACIDYCIHRYHYVVTELDLGQAGPLYHYLVTRASPQVVAGNNRPRDIILE